MLIAALSLASAAGASLRVERPADDRFFAKPSVPIEIRGPERAERLSVEVEGRQVGAAFKRVRPGVWRARLRAPQVRRGVNHLVAVSRDGRGREDYAAARFVVGKPRPGLLRLGAAGAGAAGVATPVLLAGPPQRLSAKLNGKRLRWPSGSWPSNRALLRLGADDGLRFGANSLRVFAARTDGAFDVERRTIRVRRDRPLVGAGADRRIAAGTGARLDGRASRAARTGAGLRYRWALVRKPRGSKAKLLRSSSARPSLRADRPGTYRARLTVTEIRPGGLARRGADTATVQAVPNVPPIGVPIETMFPNGLIEESEADMAIRIGATKYWLGQPKGNQIQAVILDRSTLEPLYSAAYVGTKADAEKLEAEIGKHGNRVLVVISAPDFPSSAVNAAFVPIVKGLGAPTGPIGGERTGWSVIGVPGSKGGAYLGSGLNVNPTPDTNLRGRLDGYLQEAIVDEPGAKGFAFVPSERVTFDTAAPGAPALANRITVGTAEYASASLPACATGGFQVLALVAETLVPASSASFATNGCGAAADSAGLAQMAAFLASISATGTGPAEGPKLLIVQSIGAPYDAAASGWNEVATGLERLGGTGSVFGAARAGYSLVGGIGISGLQLTEASQTLTGKPARIGGLMVPDRRGAFQPMLASPTGQTPYDLTEIAYQPSQPWPASQTKGERAALAYIAEKVLDLPAPTQGSSCYVPARPDVRSEYCNLAKASSWSGYVSQVREAPYKKGNGFTKEDWEKVTAALAAPGYNEFNAVSTVWALIGVLQRAFGTGSAEGQVDLGKIATEVQQAIAPPEQGEATGWWLELLANLAAIASYYDFGIEDEVAQKITGTLSGALFITGQNLYDREGDPLAEEFKLDAKDVAVTLSERYTAASSALGRVGELLVSDAGKLRAASQDPALGISSEGVEELVGLLRTGGKQWSYGALLPIAYEAVGLQRGELLNNPLPASANQYECEFFEVGGGSGGYFPFKAPAAAQLRTEAPATALGVLVLRGSELPSNGNPEQHPRSPTKSLLEPLFKSPEAKGLGLYAPWFWRSAFAYPSAATKSVRCA